MISVHDNNVYAYAVDCEHQCIKLHTLFDDRQPREFTDIVFTDVVAHFFQYSLPGNVLFDILQVAPETIVQQYAETFKDSWRYGWPQIEYDGDLELLQKSLRDLLVKGFEISSSYGLCGWILAKNCERITRAEKFGDT